MDTPLAANPLVERIAVLERQNRRLRVLGIAALALAVAALVVVESHALGVRRELRTQSFVLVTRDGREAGRMQVGADGPVLTLEPGRAGAKVVLGSFDDLAGFGVLDEHGDGVKALTSASGWPAFSANSGASKVIVGADGNGANAVLIDRAGRSLVKTTGMACLDGAGGKVTCGSAPSAAR